MGYNFERRVALLTGVLVILVILYLVIRNEPFKDQNLIVLIRIVLSLAVGLVGATIPGFLEIQYNLAGFAIRAGGALALFVITFFGTPEVQALGLKPVEVSYLRKMDVQESGCDSEGSPVDRMQVTDEITFFNYNSEKYSAGALVTGTQELEVYDLALNADEALKPYRTVSLYKNPPQVEKKWNINVVNSAARLRYKWKNANYDDPGLGTYSIHKIRNLDIELFLPKNVEISNISFEPSTIKDRCIAKSNTHFQCTDVGSDRVIVRWDWDLWAKCS